MFKILLKVKSLSISLDKLFLLFFFLKIFQQKKI